ncbi:MAG TPA: SDR family oxidoreductase [Kofleriaceae bacterium]|nr:SDR family oxidoreductase [Kofleriaceae bacterium]
MTLSSSHVIVFGGSSGIGLAIARACLSRGAAVTIASRSAARLAAAADGLAAGDRLVTEVADIADEAAVARVVAARPVDHVVISTVDPCYAPIRELAMARARALFDAKLFGALHVAKHARLPATGSLTVVSGIAAERPMAGGAAVTAVNGALDALVRALAGELAPARANALSPGWVDTPAWDGIGDKARRLAERARSLPVGRIGAPDDLAAAALFLIENGFTTGEVLHVDGGHRFAS